MNDFLLIFRNGPSQRTERPSETEMAAIMDAWKNWMGGLFAAGKMVNPGNPLEMTGKVVKAGHLVTDGPFAEVKELVGGYTIIKADSLEEAAELTKGCPVFNDPAGSVEIRQLIPISM
ncbi:MAG: YciI family protein [Bacteroidota bacterium]